MFSGTVDRFGGGLSASPKTVRGLFAGSEVRKTADRDNSRGTLGKKEAS